LRRTGVWRALGGFNAAAAWRLTRETGLNMAWSFARVKTMEICIALHGKPFSCHVICENVLSCGAFTGRLVCCSWMKPVHAPERVGANANLHF
jgi:hypothetical protein